MEMVKKPITQAAAVGPAMCSLCDSESWLRFSVVSQLVVDDTSPQGFGEDDES